MISFIIPLLNEEENIPLLYSRLLKVLPSLDKTHELIFIDDGSRDGSLAVLKKLGDKDRTIRIFSFRRNRGKAEALTLGFQMAKGNIIVTMDADLQDMPEEVGKLLKKQKEGYDVVSGWKKERHDPIYKTIASRVFNRIVGIMFGLRLHDYNCGLKVYTKDAAKSLRLYGGMYRFIPLMAYEQGFSVTEVPVEHAKRLYGKSKYGFSKLWKDLPDLFTMLFLTRYGKRPLHFFGTIGSIAFVIGISLLLYLMILQTFYHQAIGRRPLLFGSILLILSGLQIAFTGFLADLIINVFHNPQLERDRLHFYLKYDSDKDGSDEIVVK